MTGQGWQLGRSVDDKCSSTLRVLSDKTCSDKQRYEEAKEQDVTVLCHVGRTVFDCRVVLPGCHVDVVVVILVLFHLEELRDPERLREGAMGGESIQPR